jgi:HEPN domain-containing protein
MKQITQEWIDKAEGDWAGAQRAARARKNPSYSIACFHAYETADKYLKARLAEAGVQFERTLALKKTMKLALAVEPDWKEMQADLSKLSVYTIDYLYPGKQAGKDEAREAVDRCRRVRKVIRTAFRLPV